MRKMKKLRKNVSKKKRKKRSKKKGEFQKKKNYKNARFEKKRLSRTERYPRKLPEFCEVLHPPGQQGRRSAKLCLWFRECLNIVIVKM